MAAMSAAEVASAVAPAPPPAASAAIAPALATPTLASAALARDGVLPATSLLSGVLPLGGLQRGTTTIVGPPPAREGTSAGPALPGSTTLALELLAGVSRGGHWCAAVGLPHLGVAAAAEHGILLDHLLLVPSPGPAGRWQQVLATLFDGVGAVLFAPAGPVRQPDARRLSARARDRGSLLIVLDRHSRWGERGHLRLSVVSSSCSGLSAGHGLVASRSLEIEVSGRGAASRPRRAGICA